MKNLLQDKSGATVIEYALVAGMISIIIVAAVSVMGSTLKGTFDSISTAW